MARGGGLVAIGGYVLGAAGGLSALHPDFGIARTNRTFRSFHKVASRAFTAVGFLAIATGWYKLDGVVTTGMLTLILAILSWVLLRDKVRPAAYGGLDPQRAGV